MADEEIIQVKSLASVPIFIGKMLEARANIELIASRVDTVDEKDCPLIGYIYDHDVLVEILQPGYRDVCCPFCLKHYTVD